MQKKLLAFAALAFAAIAMPATSSPAREAQFAIEGKAQTSPADPRAQQQALEIRCVTIRAVGDYHDVISPATLAIACEGWSPLVVAAAVGRVDRDPIAPPLLL
jgi:hypothetical protein